MWGTSRVHLGPLLFSLYINDLPIHTTLDVTLLADDTVLLMKNKNVEQLQQSGNQELLVIDDWMKYNKLSLNYTKTNFFICEAKRNTKSIKNFRITMGKHVIQSVEIVKYLGVTLHKQLKWDAHIDNMMKKLTVATRIFSTIRHYVSKQTH